METKTECHENEKYKHSIGSFPSFQYSALPHSSAEQNFDIHGLSAFPRDLSRAPLSQSCPVIYRRRDPCVLERRERILSARLLFKRATTNLSIWASNTAPFPNSYFPMQKSCVDMSGPSPLRHRLPDTFTLGDRLLKKEMKKEERENVCVREKGPAILLLLQGKCHNVIPSRSVQDDSKASRRGDSRMQRHSPYRQARGQ